MAIFTALAAVAIAATAMTWTFVERSDGQRPRHRHQHGLTEVTKAVGGEPQEAASKDDFSSKARWQRPATCRDSSGSAST